MSGYKLVSLLIIFSFLLITCKNKIEKEVAVISQKNIQFNSIQISEVEIPKVETSYDGFFTIKDDSIVYLDKMFCWKFVFNKEGELLERSLGQGKGPKEVNTGYIDGLILFKNRKYGFLGSSFDFHIHKENGVREKSFVIGWEGEQDIDKVRNNPIPNPNEFSLYTLDYFNLILRCDSYDNIYIPIYGENQNFNGFNSERYYKEGKILARLNVKSKKVDKLLGSRSIQYLEKKFLGHHSFFSYDIDKDDNFIISHEIDSLIYLYDKNFKTISVFGNAGKDMVTDYYEVKEFNFNQVKDLVFNNRPKKGWYHFIEYFDDLDLLFRSYTKGGESEFDGLQIYKNKILIADVSVPKGFIVKGYIEPYFFAELRDFSEEKEELKLFKFTIPKIFL
jgi:hypothetical protein